MPRPLPCPSLSGVGVNRIDYVFLALVTLPVGFILWSVEGMGPALAIIGIAGTAILAIRAWTANTRPMARLRRVGIRTQAEVVEAGGQTETSWEGWTWSFVVRYRYSVGGVFREGRREFGYRRKVKTGDLVEILYDPDDLDVSVFLD